MTGSERALLHLQADQLIAGRSFCDPAHTAGDRATLGTLRETLRSLRAASRAPTLRFRDAVGDHHVVVPDWEALAVTRPAAIVGFFGQARDEVDHAAICELEHDIVGRATAFPGLLAYHNAQLASGRWGNLVVFRSPAATAAVTGDPVHASAVARTPRHYRSLRLHRGRMADGCLGGAPAVIDETLYLEFDAAVTWRAVRRYA